jgi:hypothetical protein
MDYYWFYIKSTAPNPLDFIFSGISGQYDGIYRMPKLSGSRTFSANVRSVTAVLSGIVLDLRSNQEWLTYLAGSVELL